MKEGKLRSQIKETRTIFSRFNRNAKACILVEPLWGIPYNLFITYASVYMLTLGCTEKQIGLIASVSLALQVFFSLIGGYITDKLGRRKTSLIFDLISWSVPAFIWAIAQNFYYFLAAAMVNSLGRIVHTAWSCLLVEDTPPEDRVHVFTWVQVAGILSGFFAPLAGFFVNKYELVPAVRGLYFFAFVSMSSMFILRHTLVRETKQGIKRMEESKDERFWDSMKDYRIAARELVRSPFTMMAFLLSVFTNIHTTIRANFFALVLTEKLGFAQGSIAIFPAVQAGVMLLVVLFIMPTLGKKHFKKPLTSALGALFLSNFLLVVSPAQSFTVVIISTVLMAYGTAVSFPFIESILANSIDDEERAKILSILYVFLFAISTPFGYIGGVLSSKSEELPFLLMTIIYAIATLLVFVMDELDRKNIAHEVDSLDI